MDTNTDNNTLRISNNKDLTPHMLRMMFDEPFFASVLRGINVEFGDVIPTAGVAVKDGDVHLLVNPEFVSGIEDAEVKGLLKHECFHLAFEHCTSRKLEPHMIHNIAADLAINSDIPENELPKAGLVPGRQLDDEKGRNTPIGRIIPTLPKHQSTEWYFSKLMEDPEVQKQAAEMSGEGGGGAGAGGRGRGRGPAGSGFGFDDHDGWGEMTEEEKELVKGKIRAALGRGVKEADRTGRWGTVSASMREKLREMVSNEVDWKAILKQFVGLTKRGSRTTSWSNLNVVHLHEDHGPMATGAKRGYTSSIAVYIDQSGSVGDRELQLAFGELSNLARHTEFTTYHFDTEVDLKSETVWKRKNGHPAHRTRAGGTDFTAPTKHANENKGRFDGMIIITDGEAAKPVPARMKRCYLLVPGQKLLFTPDPSDFVVQMKWPKK